MITRNAAQCVRCGDTIESKHRHDFQSCSCGAIFVDGGLEYVRSRGNPEDFRDLSSGETMKHDPLCEWATPCIHGENQQHSRDTENLAVPDATYCWMCGADCLCDLIAKAQQDMLAKCITLIEESVPWSTENWVAVNERAAILADLRALRDQS
jgi:hypothetical protein